MKLKIQDNYLNHPAYSGLITQLEYNKIEKPNWVFNTLR